MTKKLHARIIIIVLAVAFILNCAEPMPVMAVTFKSYKVIVTTARLNIRSTASTKGRLVGYYYKNNIVDVIGTSGSWLKTAKGFISSSYAKRYTGSSAAAAFKPYKAIITTSRLTIRSTASANGKFLGYYYKNNIVDITGQSGSWLKTSKGYISSIYAKKYTPVVSRGGQAGPDSGKYIIMNNDEQLLTSPGGAGDERYAVKGKTYKVIYDVDGYYGIKFGSIVGYIPSTSASVINGVPKNKITLAWNYIYAKSSNKLYYDDSNDYINRSSASVGLDVISPTWFTMSGSAAQPSGIGVSDISDSEYITRAHRNGYEIWACFKEGNAERAYKTFYDSTVRDRVITQVLNYAKQYNIDGINIDFEGIGGISQNKDGFTLFVREFYTRANALNINVSVDVIKPSTSPVWSKWYDRAALSQTADYLVYMAYDEHSSGSTSAGSVGSYAWVEDGIKNILAEGVPASKLILGVPFYLRDFTILEINTLYDSVIPTEPTSLYKEPADSQGSQIADAQPGLILKNNGIVENKYYVGYNDQMGYIEQAAAVTYPAYSPVNPVNASDGLRLPYNSVAAKTQALIYSQNNETAAYIIGSIGTGTSLKYTGITENMYIVDYNGQQGYIPQRDTAMVAAGNNILEIPGLQFITFPYDTVLITSKTAVNSTPTVTADNKIADVTSSDTLRYTGTSGNWYTVSYNGQTAYISKSDSIFVYANTKRTKVITSASMKMQTAFDRIASYGGTTYYDSSAKQQVGVYYKDGSKHIVWLETPESMGWRMDFINSYDLPGMGAWQLYQETPDTWDLIKSKLKN